MKHKILFATLLSFFSFSLFGQTPIFAPGMTITGFNSVNSPGGEPVTNAIDGTTNKFLDFDEFDGMGFTVDLGGLSRTATSIEITTANDAPGRDPQTYEVFGSNNGVAFTSIATGAIPCIATRLFARTFTFANATAYTYYRINFGTRCGTDSEMQVAEVQLYEPATNMVYVSSTAAQPNTSSVGVSSTNQEIIRIKIVTTGSANPLDATQLRVRTNGTTNSAVDISNAKIWYTGTSSTFATTTQFGATVGAPPVPGTNMIFNGTQTLASGTNYFWLSYDIPAGATIGNVVDALLQRITVDGLNYNPTTSAPAGDRIIAATCTHTARLTDTFGDGWNGGTVTISVNGAAVYTNISCAVAGPDDFTFQAASGDVINITETAAGTFPGEMRVEILDGSNASIWGASDPAAAPGNNTTGDCPIPPDDPCSAKVITVGCSGSKEGGDNTGMTDSGISNPSCGTYSGGDVWYYLTVPASGIVKVEAYAGTLSDVAMSVYSVSGICSSTFTQLACDDNSGFGNMPEIILTGQTPGNRLYIRVWDNNNNQTGTFEIDAADLSSDYCVTGDGTDQGSGCAELTAAVNDELGSIWDADDKFDFTSDFTYDFVVNLGSSDAGADGLCFVIQNDPAGLGANGTSGGAMGAGGITNSLIVEIDTYLNTEDRNDGLTGPTCAGGTDPDHMDIWLNGDVNPGSNTGCPGIGGVRYIPNAVNLMNGGSDYNIENGLDHTLRISYTSGTQTLTATTMNAAATVTYGTVSYSPIDPMVLFGTNAPYFGFTASTGGLNNNQTACLAPSLILPIELANFSVNCQDGIRKVGWTTYSEISNDYFTIERSVDGINFEELGTVLGAGNSNTLLNYSWIDSAPLQSTSYYRLKQTDFNGEYSYSDLSASTCKITGGINIYPNPSTGTFTFEYISEEENLIIEIYNMAGQLVQQKAFNNLPLGISRKEIDLGTIDNGVYFVSFITSKGKQVQKLTIVN
jgi:Bacterial lectin/Secretion system C-terminal sorting domain/N-terminal domain of BNR-repeat neuraminidase